jgi:hypothetical protein
VCRRHLLGKKPHLLGEGLSLADVAVTGTLTLASWCPNADGTLQPGILIYSPLLRLEGEGYAAWNAPPACPTELCIPSRW